VLKICYFCPFYHIRNKPLKDDKNNEITILNSIRQLKNWKTERDPKHTFLHFFQKAQKATQFKTILKSTLLVWYRHYHGANLIRPVRLINFSLQLCLKFAIFVNLGLQLLQSKLINSYTVMLSCNMRQGLFLYMKVTWYTCLSMAIPFYHIRNKPLKDDKNNEITILNSIRQLKNWKTERDPNLNLVSMLDNPCENGIFWNSCWKWK
jgi:predicted phosphatase